MPIFFFRIKRVKTSNLIIDFWVKLYQIFTYLQVKIQITKKHNILTSYVQGLSSSISGHLESTLSNLCLKLCPLWNKLMSILTPKSIISNVALTFLNMSELVWASVLNSGCLVTCNNKKHVIRYEITWLSKKIYQLVECNASSKILKHTVFP